MSELSKQIELGRFERLVSDSLSEMFQNANEIESRFNQVITVPINLSEEKGFEILELYYTASWFHIFEIVNVPRNASIFEIGAGDTVYIPKAMNAYSSGNGGNYVTANLNKELSQRFREKTEGLNLSIQIIEDDGANILNHLSKGSMEVIAFHHAINDIIQTIIAKIENIDTINNNWWEIEPQLLSKVMEYHNSGKLKIATYDAFVSLIDTCRKLLKPGGYMVFDNCTYAGYEAMGYSSEFHSSYINMAREWIEEAGLGLEEVELKSYDKMWWMVLRKL